MRSPLCFIVFILLFHTNIVLSQTLRGIVYDTSEAPVPGASVFIKELNFGLITNNEGKFQVNLEKGQYSLICKSIGYNEAHHVQIVQDEDISAKIILTPNEIFEYSRVLKKDTIAEKIIRKAIRTRPEYKYYKASSYIKGDLVMTQISQLTNKLVEKIEKINILDWQNKPIHQEIYSDVEFQAPNIYNIQVTGYSGNISDELNQRAAIGLLDESLYSERYNNCISPLNPRAFSYYRYYCTDTYIHNNQKCYIVKVKSKKNDPELLNGELHIMEDGNVNYSRLTRSLQGVDFTTTTTYYNIDDEYNIPVTHQINLHMHAFGNSGKVTYLTSLKYKSIGKNVIPKDVLEEKGIKYNITAIEDSIFWNEVRTLPANPPDTIKFEHFNIKKYNSKPWFGKILMGDYIYGSDSSKWSVGYGGVKMIFRDYNYVDGFWLGQRFYIKSKLDNGKTLEISPFLYYTTARHRMIGGSDLTYNYLPAKDGKLTFAVGSHTADFNNLSITRYNNYFSSLFLGKNYNSFYQRDYVTVSNNIDLTKRLKLSASLGVERRAGLNNNTDFTLVKVKRHRIIPNIYPDKRFDRTFYSMGLSFSPYANYTIENNEPPLVFHLEFEQGFSAWQTNNSRYKKLKGGVVQNIRLNYFDKIDYKIEGGAFIGSRKNLHFADYQFYGSPDLVFNLGSLFDSFLLLDNYELQANHYWINLSLNYSGKYVLLKRLPFLQGKPFFEGLHFKTLYTPDIKFYSEVGYSLNITRLFGIGVFSSFNNFDYKNAGVRFSLNLQSLKILREQE